MSTDPASANDGHRIDSLLERVIAELRARNRSPASTYRFQFHAGFSFADASCLAPYLRDLGISDCYASPYLKARPGSKHGYDIVDHNVLNPEIGNDSDYEAWVEAMRKHGLGQVLDIVPNHMGIVGNENSWWNDVLENGPCAHHAGFFDIDWYPVKPELREKVLLPVLGNPYGKVLESAEIALTFETGAFVVHYFDHRFPVAPETAQLCLRHRLDELEQALGKTSAEVMEYQSILTALSHLPGRNERDAGRIEERYREKEVIKRRLAVLVENSVPMHQFIEQNVAIFNGTKGQPHSFDLLDGLLNEQAYRLAFWRVAADEINYRRFFDINDLAALSMEKPEVFDATHRLILRLVAQGKVNGLRVDHLDGLFDPKQYLDRLQEHGLIEQARQIAASQPDFREEDWPELDARLRKRMNEAELRRALYVVVEKILGKNEPMPSDWQTCGTTGYEFLNLVNGLFVDPAGEVPFSRLYRRFTGMDPAFREYVYQNKILILRVALSSELYMLGQQLDRLSENNRWSRDFTQNSLRHALREIIACFPVYRSYIADEVRPRDRHYVEAAVGRAKRKNPAISGSIFDFLHDMLLLHYPEDAAEEPRSEQRRFVGKFQQVTGPAMAKGLEDTTFYVYNRLISLNEVGGDPGRFGVAPEALHYFLEDRQRHWPHALSASATHDTKRGEDARARINVLSELPREWQTCLAQWGRWNRKHRTLVESNEAPSRDDEYLLYQTLIGAWPAESPDRDPDQEFVERIAKYMEKAIHEAKVHTSWINPDPAYDEAVRQFVLRVLDPKANGRFLDDFRAFQKKISRCGMFNSLSQTLLKIAAPGVPDFYQGTELWDFSLVDPDNRRAVDHELRRRLLGEILDTHTHNGMQLPNKAQELLRAWPDGRIKLFVIERALRCRRDHSELFAGGEYAAIQALGSRADNVFAFARRLGPTTALAVVPRLVTRLPAGEGDFPLGAAAWEDSALLLPGETQPRRYRDVFTGRAVDLAQREGQAVLALADVFSHLPLALLVARSEEPA